MEHSISNWYAAGGKLAQIRESCEAFQRGDQPVKIDHLSLQEVMDLYYASKAIVEFCVASFERYSKPHEFKHYQTYQYARSYSRTMAHVLLLKFGLGEIDHESLRDWLVHEQTLPTLNVQYV